MEDQRPVDRQGLRVGGRLRGREAARLRADAGEVGLRAVQPLVRARARSRSTSTSTRSRTRRRARRSSTFSSSYYDVNQAIVVLKGTQDREACTRSRACSDVQARRAARHDELRLHQEHDQAVDDARRLPAERRRDPGAEEQADRRARRRPADRVLRHGRAGAERDDPRPVPGRAPAASTSGWCSRRATRSPRCVERRAREAEGERDAGADPAAVAGEGDRRPGPQVDPSRGPQLEDPRRLAHRRRRPAERRDRARSARSSSSA